MIRTIDRDSDDLDAWVAIRNAVVPNEPSTVAQVRASNDEESLFLLVDGRACGLAARSNFGGRAFVAVRVLPEHRRQGLGTALYLELAKHMRSLGLDGVNAFVYADEPHSIAFAEHFGLTGVDYQLEQIRAIGVERAPEPVDGIEVVSLDGRREELLREVWPVALEGYADMPLPGEVTYKLDTWLREEATVPGGSFAAVEDGEIVGYTGLMEHAEGPATAENGLTVVRRDHRRRGIARYLKGVQLHWAGANGITRIVTWTQKGNEGMQAVNRSLGFVDVSKVITFQGQLP